MKQSIARILISNIKGEISKDDAKLLLECQNIPIKEYNNQIMNLAKSLIFLVPTCKTQSTEVSDRELIRKIGKSTEYNNEIEEREAAKKLLLRHSMYKKIGKLLTKEDIMLKMKAYADEINFSTDIDMGCAESLEMLISEYIKDLLNESDINGIKERMEKDWNVFNGLISENEVL